MYKVTKYPQGTFSWADCVSTDAAKAKKFYAELMGWGINDIPMSDDEFYTMFQSQDVPVSGLGQMQKELQEMGIPSHWNNYVAVDDVDAMTEKAKELGATDIQGPFDIFDSGRLSFLQDPSGARFGLWQAYNHIGAGLVNTPGAMAWNELMTRDTAAATKFYSELLGWQVQKDENMDYHYIMNNGRMNGGIMPLSEEWGDAPSAWMVYFSVADVDAAVEKVKANGGKVITDIIDAQGIGRFAIIADPAGAHCSVIQLEQPQTWEDN
jgi:hypothetical protein